MNEKHYKIHTIKTLILKSFYFRTFKHSLISLISRILNKNIWKIREILGNFFTRFDTLIRRMINYFKGDIDFMQFN